MKIFQIILSALTVFGIVAGGSFLAVVAALAGQPINILTYRVIIVTGLLAAMKDIRATMSLPPLSNGNYDSIKRLMNNQITPNETIPPTPPTAPTDQLRTP